MNPEGRFLAATTHDGRVNVYDTMKIQGEVKEPEKVAHFETKGSFGMCVDIVCPVLPNRPMQPSHAKI